MLRKVHPSQWADGTPARVVAEFLLAIQERSWSRAVQSCQPSWAEAMAGGAIVFVKTVFERLHVLDVVYIVPSDEPTGLNGEVAQDYKARIRIKSDAVPGSRQRELTIRVRVIRENADGAPDPAGAWGVNPLSFQAKLMQVHADLIREVRRGK